MINPKITRQMEKQPNLLLWHGVFLLMVLAAIFGIYKAVQAVDYTWRWERIPQYIAYQAEQKQYAEFDGTVVTGTLSAGYRAVAQASLTIERVGVAGQGGRGGFSPGVAGRDGQPGRDDPSR